MRTQFAPTFARVYFLGVISVNDKKQVPDVRFEGFSGPWEKQKLGKNINWSKGSGLPKSELNQNKIGFPALHYADLYKFSAVEDSVINWTEADGGQLIPCNSILFPMSDVTPNGLARTSTLSIPNIRAGGDVLIGQLDANILAEFISFQINANSSQILPLITGTTVKHISSTALSTLDVMCTNLEEQAAIGNFFRSLDEAIALEKQQYNKMVSIKKAMLEKMFPKKGATVPEIRFEGFTEPWTLSSIGKIMSIRNDVAEPNNYTFDVELENIESDKGTLIGDTSVRTKTRSFFKMGDTLFGRLRPYLNKWWLADRDGLKSGEIWALSPFNDNSNEFIYLVVQGKEFLESANISSGTKMPRADWGKISETEILVPKYNEQTAIGNFFRKIDNLIHLHTQSIEKLQNIKEACLGKMFV